MIVNWQETESVCKWHRTPDDPLSEQGGIIDFRNRDVEAQGSLSNSNLEVFKPLYLDIHQQTFFSKDISGGQDARFSMAVWPFPDVSSLGCAP